MLLHFVGRRFFAVFLAGLMLSGCQALATPPAATLPLATSAPPSATSTAIRPTLTATAIPPTLSPTATPSATSTPTPRPPIPTADFAPGALLGVWHRYDSDRGDLYLTFRDDGTYSAAHGSTFGLVHGGQYTLEGRLFTFVNGWNCSPMTGQVVGQYLIRIINQGKFLYFDRYGDRCPDRPDSLAGLRWERVIATPTPMP